MIFLKPECQKENVTQREAQVREVTQRGECKV
jgi:hypothetical protein